MPAQTIADKVNELQLLGLSLGEPLGPESETFDLGATKIFEFGQIWAHPRVGASECHGLILDAYRTLGGEASQLGYPTSDEVDDPEVPGGRMNTFEFGRLRWQPGGDITVELDEVPPPPPWVIVKVRDEIAPSLGSFESISLVDFAQSLDNFLLAGTLDAVLALGLDLQLTRAWEPVSPGQLQLLVEQAEANEPSDEQVNLEAFLRIVLPDFADAQIVADLLNQASGVVELAYVGQEPGLPGVVGTTNPNFSTLGYLQAGPLGVNAVRAWELGADGSGVSIIDIERGWFFAHEDLPDSIRLLAGANSPHGHYHGTAVLGVMVAKDDKVGGVGLAPGATCHTMSWSSTGEPPELAARIAEAALRLNKGDIIVLEAQLQAEVGGEPDVDVPVETDPQVFHAIENATRIGIVVVEAGGNGDSDLDRFRDAAGVHVLKRTDPGFRESGAIMVGASTSPVPHTRLDSNFGSRIDCYAWGEHILAPGALPTTSPRPPVTRKSYWPLNPGFGRTSGATAIIGGVAALIQHLAARSPTTPGKLSSKAMRALFADPNLGSTTSDDTVAPIGRQPDLGKIADRFA